MKLEFHYTARKNRKCLLDFRISIRKLLGVAVTKRSVAVLEHDGGLEAEEYAKKKLPENDIFVQGY